MDKETEKFEALLQDFNSPEYIKWVQSETTKHGEENFRDQLRQRQNRENMERREREHRDRGRGFKNN